MSYLRTNKRHGRTGWWGLGVSPGRTMQGLRVCRDAERADVGLATATATATAATWLWLWSKWARSRQTARDAGAGGGPPRYLPRWVGRLVGTRCCCVDLAATLPSI